MQSVAQWKVSPAPTSSGITSVSAWLTTQPKAPARTAPKPYITLPTGASIKATAVKAATQGYEQTGQGALAVISPGSLIQKAEGVLTSAGGLANIGLSAFAPFMGGVSKLIQSAGDALANTKPLQQYGLGSAGTATSLPSTQPDAPTRILNAIQNFSNIAGFLSAGIKTPEIPKLPTKTAPIEPQGVPVSEPLGPHTMVESPKTLETSRPTSEAVVSSSHEPTTQTHTVQPPEVGKVVESTRGADLLKAAVEKRLATETGELPTHTQMSKADQASKAVDYMLTNPEEAKAVAMGKAAPPEGIRAEAIYAAHEEAAIKNNDFVSAKELTQSSVPTEAGRGLGLLNSTSEHSPVQILRDLYSSIKEAAPKKAAAVKRIIASEKSKVLLPKEETSWENFLNKIQC